MSIISVTGACKTFKGRDYEVHALDRVSLDVNEGELCVIYGMSGSGKTTLLKTIGSLLKPDSGTVNVCGKEIYKISSKKRADIRNRDIGFIYQDYGALKMLICRNYLYRRIALNRHLRKDKY